MKNNKQKPAKKKFFFVPVALLIIQLLFSSNAYAAENQEQGQMIDQDQIISEQLNTGEILEIEEMLKEQFDKGFGEIFPNVDPGSIIKDIAKGDFKLDIGGLFNNILKYIFKEIHVNLNLLLKLVAVAILCAVLKNLQSSFLSESVGELAFFTCYVAMVSILVVSLNTALELGKGIIDNMVAFMHSTIPVLTALMITGGNIATGGILKPVLIIMVEFVATFFRNVLLPLVFLSAVLSIVNNISDKVHISKLAGLLKQISTWSIGITLTFFIAAITIQGSVGAVIDGVTSKTAKFAIGAFIPVAGKYLADAADTVLGCTLLIKNAAGIAVMLGIIATCLVPLIKIFAMIMLYRLVGALIEPISEKRITNCINDIAVTLTYILGIAASVSFMFLITSAALISAGNISAMVR